MKRALLLSFMFTSALVGYACSSENTDNPPPTPTPEAGTETDTGTPGDKDSSTQTDGNVETDSSVPSGNPIEGIAAPTAVTAFPTQYLEGPAWVGNSLYVSEYATPGNLIQFTPGAATDQVKLVRAAAAGTIILGNAPDPKTANAILSLEVVDGTGSGAIVRTPVATVPAAGTAITLTATDAGGPPAFDAPNDIVVNKDGVIYLSDPGYQNPGTTNNHIWRISPTGETFETVATNRPNGIALSPDEKTLYVSYSDAPSRIDKFVLGTGGAIGAKSTFASIVPGGNVADGLAVDTGGNVYCAVKNGVDVFKPDGSLWGHIPTVGTKQINGLAFGGADKKTLYMTVNVGGGSTGGLLQVNVKVAGLAQ